MSEDERDEANMAALVEQNMKLAARNATLHETLTMARDHMIELKNFIDEDEVDRRWERLLAHEFLTNRNHRGLRVAGWRRTRPAKMRREIALRIEAERAGSGSALGKPE